MVLDDFQIIGIIVTLLATGIMLRKRVVRALDSFRDLAGDHWPSVKVGLQVVTVFAWVGIWLAVDDHRRNELQAWFYETAPGVKELREQLDGWGGDEKAEALRRAATPETVQQ
ncbi:MAG: hypothetical protein ACPGOV_16460 [Magnetovibrionaceae bacterium]